MNYCKTSIIIELLFPILFVDFVRPLRFPFNLINKFVLGAAVFSPFIKEAQENHKNWEKKFYNN